MFNVSRAALIVVAVIGVVLLVVGLATDVGPIGWGLAVILGAYVVAALIMRRRSERHTRVDERDAQPREPSDAGLNIRADAAASNYLPRVDEGRPPH